LLSWFFFVFPFPLCDLFLKKGGQQDINHDAMPGDLSFGMKNVRNSEVNIHTNHVSFVLNQKKKVVDGEPNELGIVSVAGLNWARYCSQREMEEDFYFQVVKKEREKLF